MEVLDYPTLSDAVGWDSLGLPFWYGSKHDQPYNGTNYKGSYRGVRTKWLAATDKSIAYLYRNQLQYSSSRSGANQASIQIYIYDGDFVIKDGEFLGGKITNGYSIQSGHTNPARQFSEFNTYKFPAPLQIGKGIPDPDLRAINDRLSGQQWINYSSSTEEWNFANFSGTRTSTGQWSQRSDNNYETWDEVKSKLIELGFPTELLFPLFTFGAGDELGVLAATESAAYLAAGFNPDPDYKIELPNLYFVDATNISPDRSQFVNGHVRTGDLAAGAWLNYRYRLNESDWSKWVNGEAGANEFRVKQDGQYQVEVRQVDSDGNRSPIITSNPFNVDLTPPSPRINRIGNFKNIIGTSNRAKLIGSKAEPGRDIEIRSKRWTATTQPDSRGNFSYTFDDDDIAYLGQGKKVFHVLQSDGYENLGKSIRFDATIRTLEATRNADRLTGRFNSVDTFTWKSLAYAKTTNMSYDVITNYRPGDKIRIMGRSYNMSINQVDHKLDDFSLNNLATLLSKKSFVANDAASIQSRNGTFLAFNDSRAGFNSKHDSLILLSNYFVFQGGYDITII